MSLNPLKWLGALLSIFISNDDEEKTPDQNGETSALTQERAKTVDEK
jgi:hypothetical protein